MSRLLILGAGGSLGRHVVRHALAAGHDVTAFIRTSSGLPPDLLEHVSVYSGDLSAGLPADIVTGHDALRYCAGNVRDGHTFVRLVDRIVTSVDMLPAGERPICWLLAGAALLDVDESGRRGVDLPVVASTYWPHRHNFERLQASHLDWRLLCPGPMVEEPGVGRDRVRISKDTLPVEIPAPARHLPDPELAQVLASLAPRLIVPYADAAAVMLANIARDDAMSRHRIGLACQRGTV